MAVYEVRESKPLGSGRMDRPNKSGAGDTSLGGIVAAFPQTTWGFVARFAGPPEVVSDGVGILAGRYWKPVYRFIRSAWAKGNEDAKDLTQAFFVWLIEGDALRRYRPGRGSFRSYLKALL